MNIEMEIGEAAGRVWQVLHERGELSKAQLAKATGLTADLTNQTVGWLAREGKLTCEMKKKSQVLRLK